jgi:outer membrane protein OmpA-like peptidoglycan-associated protein
MKHNLWMMAFALLVVTPGPRRTYGEEGPIGGVDLGVAVPFGNLHDRVDTGGVISPFAGYMFTDNLGLVGQAQVLGAPTKDRPGLPDSSEAAGFGATAGPRVELPLRDASKPRSPGEIYPILYLTGQAGVFTGLAGEAFSGTSWGYSTGGGLNFRISDQFLVGGFARYNWVDQRVTGNDHSRDNIKYVTAGLALTYNLAPPPAPSPAPVVAQLPPVPPPAKKKIILRSVNFDFNKATIRQDARPILDEAVATLKQEGSVTIVAEGHTDNKGTEPYNQTLSLRRAKEVRDYLVAGGITADRITVEGFGMSRPVASNDTADGRAQNRRVELRIRAGD